MCIYPEKGIWIRSVIKKLEQFSLCKGLSTCTFLPGQSKKKSQILLRPERSLEQAKKKKKGNGDVTAAAVKKEEGLRRV